MKCLCVNECNVCALVHTGEMGLSGWELSSSEVWERIVEPGERRLNSFYRPGVLKSSPWSGDTDSKDCWLCETSWSAQVFRDNVRLCRCVLVTVLEQTRLFCRYEHQRYFKGTSSRFKLRVVLSLALQLSSSHKLSAAIEFELGLFIGYGDNWWLQGDMGDVVRKTVTLRSHSRGDRGSPLQDSANRFYFLFEKLGYLFWKTREGGGPQ